MASIRACFRPCGRPLRPAGAEALVPAGAEALVPAGPRGTRSAGTSPRHRGSAASQVPTARTSRNGEATAPASVSTMVQPHHRQPPSQVPPLNSRTTAQSQEQWIRPRDGGAGSLGGFSCEGVNRPPTAAPKGGGSEAVVQVQRFRRRRIRTPPFPPSRRWRGIRVLRRAPLHRCCPRSGAGRETGSGSPRRTGR